MPESALHWLAHAERLPTLTEVVEVGPLRPAAPSGPAATGLQPVDTRLLASQVLAEITQHLDGHFESRLRAAVAPAMARAFEDLLSESRAVWIRTLRQTVDEAVAQAVARAEADAQREPPRGSD